MLPQGDSWEVEVECAHRLLDTEGPAAFRVEMERLGFTSEEIDRFIEVEVRLVKS